MIDFFLAALPWIIIALLVLLLLIFKAKHPKKDQPIKTQETVIKTPDAQDEEEENYMSTGLCLGMCFGMAIGSTLTPVIGVNALTYGLCFGMLIGMLIGMNIKKKR